MWASLLDSAGIYGATFLVSVVSGFVPIVNAEAYLVGAGTLSSASPWLLALCAALGQMTAKVMLFLSGRGLLATALARRHEARIRQAVERLDRGRTRSTALVFASALTGLPPFYVVSIAAGVVRFPLGWFVLMGTAGRLLRFAVFSGLPHLLPRLGV